MWCALIRTARVSLIQALVLSFTLYLCSFESLQFPSLFHLSFLVSPSSLTSSCFVYGNTGDDLYPFKHLSYARSFGVLAILFRMNVCALALRAIIDKQGGEGLEKHCTYICTLTVTGAFL